MFDQRSIFSRPMPALWAVGGTRSLGEFDSALASQAVADLLRDTGASMVVGCCTGTDAAALAAAIRIGLANRAYVLGAFGPLEGWPAGTCRYSNVNGVRAAVRAGAEVHPWVGGSCSVPLSARLSGRTRVVAAAASAGALVVFGPQSRGAFILARAVARRGLPVIALAVGGAKLPKLVPGVRRWVRVPGALGLLGASQYG